MKDINKITVATDFSPNTRVAYKYGQVLAKWFNSDFELIHIHTPPFNIGRFISKSDDITKKEDYKMAWTRLRRFANNKKVKCQIHIGSVVKKLIELSKENNFDLLVVGIKEEQGLLSKLSGSVILSLTKRAYCPVLLVPKKTKVPEQVINIVYAISELSSDGIGIDSIINFAHLFKAKIHFIHVNRPGYKDKMTDITLLMKDSGVQYIVKDLEFVTIRGAIDTYCEHKSIDMIVATVGNHSVWHNLFNYSVIESLAWNSRIPLLVLPKNLQN